MKLTVNPTATKKELIADAFAFAKYGNDPEAMEYLNEVLGELNFHCTRNEFAEIKKDIERFFKFDIGDLPPDSMAARLIKGGVKIINDERGIVALSYGSKEIPRPDVSATPRICQREFGIQI